MSAFLSTSRAIALVIIATTAAPAIAQTSLPVGATALMRYWTENGTFYLNCIHPSCIEGSLVSMKPMDGKPVPASADFHREQLQVAKAGAGRIAARGGNCASASPAFGRRAALRRCSCAEKSVTPVTRVNMLLAA